MEKFFKDVGGALRRFEIPKLGFCRAFAAYFTVSLAEWLISMSKGVDPVGGWRDYVAAASLPAKLIWTAVIFVWLSIVCRLSEKRLPVDQLLLIVSSTFFAALTAYRGGFYIGLAAGAVAAVFSVCALSLLPENFRLPFRLSVLFSVFFSVLTFTFVCMTTIAKHRSFGTPCFDMGIFLQMFYSLRDNFTAVTSCERDVIMSHFNVHSSYIFYLILPIFALIPKAETLLVVQALFAIGGVVPLYLIAKNRGFSGAKLLGICSVYIFSASLIMPCYYSFHENCLLPTLIMWMLYAAEKKKFPLFYIMAALILSVKEDAALYDICFGLFYFADEKSKNRFHGLVSALLSGVYFLIVMTHLTKYGDGAYMTASRLGILMTEESGGFLGIVRNVLSDPAYFFSLFVREDTLIFLCETLLPLMLLPFITSKLRRYILVVPYVIMCLVIGAGYRYAADIGFQYVFGPACFLIYLSVLNLCDMPPKAAGKILCAAAIISLTTAVALASPKLDYVKDYAKNADYYKSAEETISLIPKDASVLSNTFLLPHACDRSEIYDFGNSKIRTLPDGSTEIIEPEKYDYLLMSLKDPMTEKVSGQLLSAGWTEYASDGFVIIYKNPSLT